MSNTLGKKGSSRRRLVKAGALAVAMVPLSMLHSRRGEAQTLDLPMLGEDDPQAQALAYHVDAASVDVAVHSTFVAGSDCSNCQLYTGGDAATGPCGIFPGKLVEAKGWCRTWVKKAG